MAFDDPDPRDALAQARARLAGSSPDDPQAVLARVRARLATAKDTFARPEVAGFDLPPVEAVPRVASDATAAPRATPVAGPTLDIQRPTPITTEDVQRATRDRALARAAEFTHVPMPVINAARGAVGGVAGMAAIPVGAVLPGAADYLTAQAERIQPAEPSLAADVGRLGGGLLTAGAMAGVTGSLAAEALPETLLGKLGQALASDQWAPRSLANAATFAPVDALEAVRRGRQTGDWGQAAEDFAKNSAMNLAGAAVFEGVRQPFMEPRVRPGAAPEVGFKPEEHPTAKVSAETAADIVEATPPPDAPPAVGDMGRTDLTAQLGELETEAAALRAAANDVPVGDPLREKFLQAAAQADAHRQRLAGMGSAEGVTITPGERLAQERIAGNPDPVAEARAANPLTDTDPARERARALEAAQGPALPPEAYVGPERRMRIESISADDILNRHRRATDLPPVSAPLAPRIQSGVPRTRTEGTLQGVSRTDFPMARPQADEGSVLERLAMQERSAASELEAQRLGTPPRMEGAPPVLPMPGTKGRTKWVGGDPKFQYHTVPDLEAEYDKVLERLDANNAAFNAGTKMWTRDDPNLGGIQRSGTSISGEAGRAKGGVSRDATYLGRLEDELHRRGVDVTEVRDRAYAARAARAKATAAENLPASLRESGPMGVSEPKESYAQPTLFDSGPESTPIAPPKRGRPKMNTAAVQAIRDAESSFATQTAVVSRRSQALGAATINSPEDLAKAAAHLGQGATERLDAILTDANGKPIAVVGGFKGGPNWAAAPMQTIVSEAFQTPGGANIWMVHNHPSGTATLSREDMQVGGAMEKAFRGSGITYRGAMAIGAGADAAERQWSHFNPQGNVVQGSVGAVGRGPTVPIVDREFTKHGGLSGQINTTDDAANAMRLHSGGQDGVLLLDQQRNPIGFIPVSPDVASHLRTEGRSDAVYRAIGVSNASAAIINAPTMSGLSANNLAGMLKGVDVEPLDVFGPGMSHLDLRPRADWGALGTHGGPGFKSRLVSAAEAIKLEKAPARTWISKLRGVASSGDEFDWALGDALKADPTRQWTKAEIVALAKERGYGSLTETVRGGKEYSQRWAIKNLGDGRWEASAGPGSTPRTFNDMESAQMYAAAMDKQPTTKFGTYVEPGGENYREVLLRVPEGPTPIQERAARVAELERRLRGEGEGLTEAEYAERISLLRGEEYTPKGPRPFTSSHWDEPNVLAHIRMNDRVGPNGEKILHIEEIQSDWHQKGRKEGYRKRPPTAPAGETDPDVLAAQSVEDALHGTVPDAPFKETPEWLGLSLKRVLDEAVAGGYDAVSWTPGAKQADRYSLRKVADEVRYNPDTEELYVLNGPDNIVHEGTYDRAALPDVIGKDAADRLLASPRNNVGRHVLSGEQLEIGGEGMKAFYDQMLPDWIRGYAKKLGVKLDVGPGEAPVSKTPMFTLDDAKKLSRNYAAGKMWEAQTIAERLALEVKKRPATMQEVTDLLGGYSGHDPTWKANVRNSVREILENKPPETGGFPSFKVTPELRTALSKGQSYGHGATTILSGITGAGFGGATGYAVGDTPEERRRNAILGALAGAAIGGGLEVGLTKLLDRRAPLFPGGKPRLTPAQVEQIATTGRMPHDLPPAGKTAPEDYAHIASFATDPDGTIRLKEELRRAGPLTRGDPKTVEPWTVVRHIANDLGFHDVTTGDVKRLNRAEMLAIRDIVHTNIEHINANVRRLQTDPTLSQAERTRLGVLVQGMEHQNIALLDRFIVARGETGRNLNAMKMFAMSTMDPVVWLAKAQQVVGGPVPDELRTALVKALGEGDREGAIKLLMDARTSTIGEKATTYWKANLLSNPLTHVVNISSNAVLAGSEQAKNVPAAMVDYLMGLAQRGQRTTSAFTVGMTRASKEGVGRGMRGAWKTITTGLSPEQGLKYDIPRQTNYDSKILQLYTESIFRTLGAEDQVFREFALSASLANQATTMARAEGFRGKLLRARVEELRLRPSDEMAIRAIGDAEEAVVRDQTRIGRWLQATAKHLPGGQFIAPFTRTPGAVATRLAEYSPLYGLPVGSYRTARVILKGLKGEQVPIEVQREAAKLFGRGATGTVIVALGAYLASKGLATGPAGASPSARQTAKVTGRSGSSLRLGDLWTDVSRVTPVGMLLALGAGMYEIHQSADTPAQELGADAFAAVKTVTDQPFLQGISQAIEGIQTLDPLKAAEQFSSRLGEGIVAGFIPASSLLAAVARGTDSVQRQTDGLGGYLATRVPGLAERQAPTVTAFGQPTPREGGLTNQLLNPLRQTRDASADPVVRAMLENGIRVNGLAKKKDETAEQFATRAMAEGQAAYAEVARTIQTMQWRLASPEERASLFDQAFQRGRQRALTKLQRQGVIPRPPRARFGGTR